jgi:hypothetical protein
VLTQPTAEVSLRQAVVLYAERYGVPGAAPARNDNLKGLLRERLEAWLERGADWIRVTGAEGMPDRRYWISAGALMEALESLALCERPGCNRPALRRDGRCGSCGVGRTGRPRTVPWELQTCAGCGAQERAPLYGRQKQWWCSGCNGRRKYEPRTCEWEGCPRLAVAGGRFCSHAHAAKKKWADGVLGEPSRANWLRIMAGQRQAIQTAKAAPGVLTIPDVAERVHVSPWTPYGWRRRGLLQVTAHCGGRVLTTSEDDVRELIRALARLNSPSLLDPRHCVVPAKVVLARRHLILPHRAGAKPKDELKAEWRKLFYELRATLGGWSDLQVCVSVAELHLRTCTDAKVWAKYPRSTDGGLRPEDEPKAARRVWMAIR